MPPRTLHIVIPLIAAVIALTPTIAQAGDAPIFVVKGWGVGTIDNRFMLYLGKDRFLDTPIPSTPKWVVIYAFVTGLLLGGFAVRAYLRGHNPTLHWVRREKEKVFSGLRDPPGNWVVPAGSSRSGGGGNEAVGAFDAKAAFRAARERAGRNASEQPMRPRNW